MTSWEITEAYYESLCDLYVDIAHHYTADIIPVMRRHEAEMEARLHLLMQENKELKEELADLKGRLQGLDN